MSDESIELPITKPKRVYTKRTKIVIDVPAIMAEKCVESHTTTPLVLPIPELVKESYIEPCVETQVKAKRAYVRKSKLGEPCVEPHTTQGVLEGLPLVVDTPPTSPVDVIPPKEKKPRTEKQLAAFEKMRSARASKQNELNDLKELEKTQRQLENEQRKLDTVTEKVLAKATELKTKRVSKKKVVIDEDGYRTEPEYIIREQKHKPIVFM
jgi:hypothetical protein